MIRVIYVKSLEEDTPVTNITQVNASNAQVQENAHKKGGSFPDKNSVTNQMDGLDIQSISSSASKSKQVVLQRKLWSFGI